MEQKIIHAKIGDAVKIHFTGKLEDGTVFGASTNHAPLQFTIGDGEMISGLEEAIIGMKIGGSKTIKISAEKAFGPYNEGMIKLLSRNKFPQNVQLEVGLQVQIQEADGGETIFRITDISEPYITLDANHPLAGKDLFFDLQLIEIVKSHIDNANEYISIGNSFAHKGQFDEAIAYYQKALQINPTFYMAYNNLGNALKAKGQFDEAIAYYQKALQINPHDSAALSNLGSAFMRKGLLDDAITCYQSALQIEQTNAGAYYNFGNALTEQGKSNQALIVYKRALELSPNFIMARWAHCMAQLLIIYFDQSEIQSSRMNYYNELMKLRETISLETSQEIEAAAQAVGSHQPFFLAYQGFNDRDIQDFYGRLVCKIMALRYPHLAELPAMLPPCDGKQLRIGVVSGYFHLHSNWKIPIKGWIENLDKKRFSLYGYYTGKIKDQKTSVARECFSSFIEDVYSVEELCSIIKKDDLHVLIYPEIGMNPMTVKLAALRLAPIQCTSWGHPETSGLPTIDYFLSSDLMEPPNADDHYTEKLIRLPNLSIYYTPLDVPFSDVSRDTFGLKSNSIIYLCCQSLFKYLPQYDEIYPRIAKEVGNCQFLFISYRNSYITEQFRLRIYQSFDKFGLKAEDYVVIMPRLDPSQYNALNHLSNIYLDSIGWSGCNSTFEAIANDLPIVTFPGDLMRGRHSAAILKMMGLTETISDSLDDYIKMAINLGQNSELRRQISEKIAANKRRIYDDRKCITALENFLERVVKEGNEQDSKERS